jgi:hypothetical protein
VRAKHNDSEAPKMSRADMDFARPYGFGDFELVREERSGAYWQAADGMVVRLAMPEQGRAPDQESEAPEKSDSAPGSAGGS